MIGRFFSWIQRQLDDPTNVHGLLALATIAFFLATLSIQCIQPPMETR